MVDTKKPPRTFFLNERQELSAYDREGRGRTPNYVPIDWTARATTLSKSFFSATQRSYEKDPAAKAHHFIIAVPSTSVQKNSLSEKAKKTGGVLSEKPDFGGEQSRVLRKIGLELIETLPGGKAKVHIPSARVPQMLSTMGSLARTSERERARWISIESFEPIQWSSRVSPKWLEDLAREEPHDVMIRFYPLLKRMDVQEILRSLQAILKSRDEGLIKIGRDSSGRHWCAANLLRGTIRGIADEFASIQSLHPPLRTQVAGAGPGPKKKRQQGLDTLPLPNLAELPTVAVVDTGVPPNHLILAPFVRPGRYRDPDLQDSGVEYMGDHGSAVASCVVFGQIEIASAAQATGNYRPGCRVHDVMISTNPHKIDDEAIIPALTAVVATAPDVRVFNLSFDDPKPLDSYDEVMRREKLIKLQELDNFLFSRDVLAVVAAGNTVFGVQPSMPYPKHLDDPNWQLGIFARTFNGIVCGSFVKILDDDADAVTTVEGSPSPFTRIGPGLCDSPVPGFSAAGGNLNRDYGAAMGSGVWACSALGDWEDHIGTSFAAPLLARQAAMVFKELSKYCVSGSQPFTSTVKAWLNLVANRPPLRGNYHKLGLRTLGKGFAVHDRLVAPSGNSAVLLWQTMLQVPGSVSRVQIPIPSSWLNQAIRPTLRVVAAWETPVNYALAEGTWGCRKVNVKLRPFGAAAALRGAGNAPGAYPIVDRIYEISPAHLTESGFTITDNYWVVEVDYEDIGEYPIGMTFSTQQRVGVAMELSDLEGNESPQDALQSLPISSEMTRFTTLQVPLHTPSTPVIVKP